MSRAVARDLRRHYGERYRIVRAESGPDALETLNELKLRGDTVAVFVADYRMPQMSGIEFLEEAMDIYPLARRVLLTAYADTHAAIDAINVVDLDHYLLKPWDPPEEKLYPVIDGLLEAWRATGDRAIPHTKVIGHRWNPRSWEVRQFLARNQHSFRSFMADESKGKQLLDAAGLDGFQLPVVITEQGETLVEPTNAELAAMLGLSTSPSLEMYDLAVIGGGPAGLAAAVYGASEGLKTVLIEETTTGGQAGRSSRIENYLGFPDRRLGRRADHVGTQAGRAVRRRGHHHPQGGRAGSRRTPARRARSSSRTAAPSAPRRSSWPPASTTASCESPAAGTTPTTTRATTSVAASTTARPFPTPRNARARTSTSWAAPTRPGRRRCSCRATAKSVTLLVRGPSLEASMSYYLIQQIEKNDNIKVRTCTEVVDTLGEDDHLTGLVLREQADRRERDRRLRPACAASSAPSRGPTGSTGGGPRRPRLHPDRPRPEGRLRLDAGPSAAPPGNKCAGCVCCR